jgi:hypothetical protein
MVPMVPTGEKSPEEWVKKLDKPLPVGPTLAAPEAKSTEEWVKEQGLHHHHGSLMAKDAA